MACSLQCNLNEKNNLYGALCAEVLLKSEHIICKFSPRKLHNDYIKNCPPPKELYTVLVCCLDTIFSVEDLLITSIWNSYYYLASYCSGSCNCTLISKFRSPDSILCFHKTGFGTTDNEKGD